MDQAVWNRYWKRAVWVTWFVRLVPFVRLVGLNGSMATQTVHAASDIDFYIVTKPGHIYTARFLVTGVVQALGLRRHGKWVVGRVCLNRYATVDFLDITEHNEYHARVFHNLYPLYAAPGVYAAYQQANQWMKTYQYPVRNNQVILENGIVARLTQWIGEAIWSFPGVERFLRTFQQKKVWSTEAATSTGSTVVTTDQELRFHLSKELYG